MQKTGQIERTIDTEFQDEHTKYKTCDTSFLAFIPEATNTILCAAMRKNVRLYRKKVKHTLMPCGVSINIFRGGGPYLRTID